MIDLRVYDPKQPCSWMVLGIRVHEKVVLSHFTSYEAVLSAAELQAAMFSVSSSFPILWLASFSCLLWFFSIKCKDEGVANISALENYSEWEDVFHLFASYLRLRYASPGGKMDYIPACSILRTDKQGVYRSLVLILILPGMYLMLIYIRLFSSFLSWVPVHERYFKSGC